MAYSLQEQINNDLDIFLFDGEKIIHIASAGGIHRSRTNPFVWVFE